MRSRLAAMGFLGDSPGSQSPQSTRISPRRFPPIPPPVTSSPSSKVVKDPSNQYIHNNSPVLNLKAPPSPLSPSLEMNTTSQRNFPNYLASAEANIFTTNSSLHNGITPPPSPRYDFFLNHLGIQILNLRNQNIGPYRQSHCYSIVK